jgi:hypothetical protein
MKYFFIDTLGEGGTEWAVLDTPPAALGLSYYRPADGSPMGDQYPEDVELVMSKKYPGVRLGSLLGNTLGYLIVDGEMRKTIEAHSAGAEIEYLPFTLRDPKGRVRSEDYTIVNPIGVVDCLNLDASEVIYLDEPGDEYHGSVVDVETYVLDPKKLEGAPALFRVKERPDAYVVNEKLAKAFEKSGFANVVLTVIEQQKSKA